MELICQNPKCGIVFHSENRKKTCGRDCEIALKSESAKKRKDKTVNGKNASRKLFERKQKPVGITLIESPAYDMNLKLHHLYSQITGRNGASWLGI